MSVITCASHTIILTSRIQRETTSITGDNKREASTTNKAEYIIIDTLQISLSKEEIPQKYPFQSWPHQGSLYHTTNCFEQAINIVQSIFYSRIAKIAWGRSITIDLTSPLLTMEARLLSVNEYMKKPLREWLTEINNASELSSQQQSQVDHNGDKNQRDVDQSQVLWEQCQAADKRAKNQKERINSARKKVHTGIANSRRSNCAELKNKQPLRGVSKDSVQPSRGEYPLKQTVFMDQDRNGYDELSKLAGNEDEKNKVKH